MKLLSNKTYEVMLSNIRNLDKQLIESRLENGRLKNQIRELKQTIEQLKGQYNA